MDSRSLTPDDSNTHTAKGDGRQDSAARMRLAISAVSRGGGSRDELRAAAVQLVSELKNANEPPEQMLLQIKQILAEAGLRPTYATPTDPMTAVGTEAAVYRDVIAWSIRHYYDGDGDGSKR